MELRIRVVVGREKWLRPIYWAWRVEGIPRIVLIAAVTSSAPRRKRSWDRLGFNREEFRCHGFLDRICFDGWRCWLESEGIHGVRNKVAEVQMRAVQVRNRLTR